MGACETLSASHAHPGEQAHRRHPATLSTSRRFPRSPIIGHRLPASSSFVLAGALPCAPAPGAPAGPRPRVGTNPAAASKAQAQAPPHPTAGSHRARPVRPLDSRGPHGCDNLSAHKAPAVHRWLLAHPRFVLHFTPTYSSWINQVERWLAELQRRCLDRGVFCSLDELTTACGPAGPGAPGPARRLPRKNPPSPCRAAIRASCPYRRVL